MEKEMMKRIYKHVYCVQGDCYVLYCNNGLRIKLDAKKLRS